jgi:hypothetical protein
MKKIPKTFKLFAHTVTVSFISKRLWPAVCKEAFEDDKDAEDCVGFFSPTSNSIFLLRQPKSQLSHSLWHEITHAVLYYLNHKLYSNEQFVDTVAGCISQVIESAE